MRPAAFTVIISPRAEQNLDAIIRFLELEWGEKVKLQFVKKFRRMILPLEIQPRSFQRFSESKRIRRCFVTKNNALFYRIDCSTVNVFTIQDTCQNPSSLAKIFKGQWMYRMVCEILHFGVLLPLHFFTTFAFFVHTQ